MRYALSNFCLRETFLKDEFPKYLGFFEQWLDASGDTFLCGNDLTIADMQVAREESS
jgi:glutathione S-transferase